MDIKVYVGPNPEKVYEEILSRLPDLRGGTSEYKVQDKEIEEKINEADVKHLEDDLR